ncbi:type III restriction endonuclease subunit R [Caenimonas koreensis DSM 17982]|uniref:Type III restriction endonuclease subunit R n=1 Tax=Caenimonas koreensis DSM 17982 TaxID=1121255 RepID=A0A844BDX9_9BURK|nr:DEAD/DEAH box helicase [Caenimonas koreensis]MRD49746.1 type III restriction endonuclease subunit R [Caenimonas koreensis DSM 17982]
MSGKQRSFAGWTAVRQRLQEAARAERDAQARQQPGVRATGSALNEGQCRAVEDIARALPDSGMLIADEVGMGKTRIAVTVARAVIESGGRVAVLVPPGLGYQWGAELRAGGVECKSLLRSLKQFLDAWKEPEKDKPEEARCWREEDILLISHAFTNWRLGSKTDAWRIGLLPELYAQWRKVRYGRSPNGYKADTHLRTQAGEGRQRRREDRRCRNAAADIVVAANPGGKGAAQMRQTLDALIEGSAWSDILERDYSQSGDLRAWLEQSVGLGLGIFDLVVVDEAHKSRGDESGLQRLLDTVVQGRQPGSGGGVRRLCMTATPIELSASDWETTLKRLQVTMDADVSRKIGVFEKATADVRARPSDAAAREAFARASADFHQALHPWLIHRDKRETESVRYFQRRTGLPFHDYRSFEAIAVEVTNLPVHWRQAICAAESLSLLDTRRADSSSQVGRLRLTIGNGHGLNAILDMHTEPPGEEGDLSHGASAEPSAGPSPDALRARHWMGVLRQALSGGHAASLHNHPALLAAVEAIESVVESPGGRNEKVLVFGRFTAPMNALVELLNARRMLRNLALARPWPKTTLSNEEWAATEVAHAQLRGREPLNAAAWLSGKLLERSHIEQALKEHYDSWTSQKDRLRKYLLRRIGSGLAESTASARVLGLFEVFAASVGSRFDENWDENRDEGAGSTGDESLKSAAAVLNAILETLGPDAETLGDRAWADAFVELVEAGGDRDDENPTGEGAFDPEDARHAWLEIAARLRDEFGGRRATFARLMVGNTPHPTRRLLQQAFNRGASDLRVLVTQSMVGREGLNLHRACRTVVLLHPEWNPGVVEQQIGRVDRLGSLWEQMLPTEDAPHPPAGEWPRIRVLSVVFKGTYDEENWRVLQGRWDDLRAQLHGIVIPESARTQDPMLDGYIDEINAAAPNFSPVGGSN